MTLFPFVAILIFAILAFLNTFFIINIFPKTKKYKYQIFFIIFLLLLIFLWSLILSRIWEYSWIWIPYKIWAFSLWASFLSLFVLFPSYIFRKIYKKDFWKYVQIFIWFLLLSINIFGIFNAYSYEIVEYTIKTEKNTNIKWKKLILIADTHYWNIFWENQAKRLVEKINSIEADWVLIAWDFFDWPTINFKEIWNIFKNINKPTFFAAWNHEEYWDFYSMISAIDSKNIIVLNNEKTKFFDSKITWVTYSENKNKENFDINLKNIWNEEKSFNILIKHEPKFAETAFENNYDLVVFWHSHKWQMWPFSIITEKIYGKYFYWLNEENWKYAITTSWVWGWWPPQRFWSRSEIVIIKII